MNTNQKTDHENIPFSTPGEKIGYLFVVVVAFVIGLAIGLTPSFRSSATKVQTDAKDQIIGVIGQISPAPKDNVSKDVNFSLFWTVWNTIVTQYVDKDVSQKDMFYGAIKGMVSSLKDPVTIFLTPDETNQYEQGNTGAFEGIGAELGYKNDIVVIVTPLEGSPAKAAGLRPGDVIMAVNGESVSGKSVLDVVTLIRGKAGTTVKLVVNRDNQEKTFSIERKQITVPSISYKGVDSNGIAVLNVDRFTEATLNDWQGAWNNAVSEIIADDPKALVIDLRGNPGGYFSASVYAASEFLNTGDIVVQEKDRTGDVLPYTVTREGKLQNIPVIVLVNEGSASASEIFSGAIQKNGRGKILGENTFGKGTAQDVIDYPDGSSLHITIYKWLLPDGKWINPKSPIIPDIKVVMDDASFKAGKDPQLDRAKQELLKNINK